MNATLDEHPGQIEVAGRDLAAKLADLKLRGAIVLAMTMRGAGVWVLTLAWPRPKQVTLPEILNGEP